MPEFLLHFKPHFATFQPNHVLIVMHFMMKFDTTHQNMCFDVWKRINSARCFAQKNHMPERKYFIDWVRVLAFFLLILFHCAMPFVTVSWEIKNEEQYSGLTSIMWWLHQWRLPLLFFVSGVGINFSLAKRSVMSFAGERFVRLFVPLVFAMLFTIPLQVYFEWLQEGKLTMSYAEFYPSVWNFVPYPDGSLTWSHLWFVVYLFVFCMLLLPVFGIFKIKAMERFKKWIADKLAHPVAAGLLFIPFMVYYFTLYLEHPEQQNLFDDWFIFTFSITLLFYGYLLGSTDKFWNTCEKYRYHFLAIAGVCISVLFYKYWWAMSFPTQKDWNLYLYGILNSVQTWFLIMAILGFAKKHLNFSNSFLKYATPAVYPFYILHQTIIVATGYYIVQWPIPDVAKFILLVVCCFVLAASIYQWLIKPFILTRILYGLKPKDKSRKITARKTTEFVEAKKHLFT